LINNVSNPSINLVRGNEYVFEINAIGHPFWIQTSTIPYDPVNIYSTGITNNGIQVGNLTFNVPVDARNTLYYVCQYHGSMNGVINITSVSVPTPVLSVDSNSEIVVPTDGLDVLTSGTPVENLNMRTVFIKDLLVDNASIIQGNKMLINTQALLGNTTTITKTNLQILNTYTTIAGLTTDISFDLNTLSTDEGVYIPLGDVNDSIILTLSAEQKIKFEKINDIQFNVYEDYVTVNSPITSVKMIGDSGQYNTFYYVVGSVSGENNTLPLPIPICFPKGTPVYTNNGYIDIDKLNPKIHMIKGKRIVAITRTIPRHNYLISIEKGALGYNVPSMTTRISKEHKILYNGVMTAAKDLIQLRKGRGVFKVPYHGEILYNVLMESYECMTVNNLTCETLHPDSIMAKIYNGNFNYFEQNLICSELERVLAINDKRGYEKLCNSLTYFAQEKRRGRNIDMRLGYHGIGSSLYRKPSK
jgi:hypothetical protein